MDRSAQPRSVTRRALKAARRAAGRALRSARARAAAAPPPEGTTPADWKARTEKLERELTRVRHEATTAQTALDRAQAALRRKTAEVDAWRARVKSPSFIREHHSWVDMGLHYRQDPSPAKARVGELNRKLWVHAFARSHGIRVPEIYAIGERPEDIRLGSLPEQFVVKSDGGTSSKAVLPLRRVGEDRYEWRGHTPYTELTTADVVRHFQRVRGTGHSYGPVFAEAMLQGPDPDRLPDDVKIYVAYGQVLQVLLRRPTLVDGTPVAQVKYVSETGQDLGKVALWQKAYAPLPVPSALPEMVDIARRISLALPMPLCRVDLYETTDGPVLGEITRTPGAPHLYRPDHDEFMGREWIKAEARLFEDMHHGRSGRPVWGPEADLSLVESLPPFG